MAAGSRIVRDALDQPRAVPLAIVGLSLGALGSAVAAEVWGGLAPCVLCLFQRYAYLGAIAFGIVGLVFGGSPPLRRTAIALAGLAFLAGAGIAFFHVGVEQQWWRGTAGCHAPVLAPGASIEAIREQLFETRFVACDEIPWSLLGISMAGYNFLVSLALAAGCLWATRRIGGGP